MKSPLGLRLTFALSKYGTSWGKTSHFSREIHIWLAESTKIITTVRSAEPDTGYNPWDKSAYLFGSGQLRPRAMSISRICFSVR